MMIRRARVPEDSAVTVRDRLVQAGLEPQYADLFLNMPHKVVHVEPRRPFREPGILRDEVMLVRSGIIAKFKSDGSGRRQIVSLRFPGEGVLPHDGTSDYGLQAIVRSEVLVGRADDFEAIVSANPAVARFFWKLVQRQNAIGYEWLVNTGRRDSTARVAHLLCETAERMGIDARHQPMHNPFTQQQIADITGQTSVNVNRVFADLERQGLIKRKGREIQFLDWNELRRVGSFNPAYLA
jgi:CRP-like cAMP-binding protein